MTLLEDRIDELLQQNKRKNNNTTTTTTTTTGYEEQDEQGESLDEVASEAYRLTSPLDSMPWLVRYRHALDQSTDSLPHDLINCPPLVLLVCTATKEITAPENVLQEFYQSNHVLPNVYKRGLYDPSTIRQEVLVLHDNHDGANTTTTTTSTATATATATATPFDENRLRQLLRSRFGTNAAILRINSSTPETAAALAKQETSDPWGGKGQLGTFLSDNDRVVLRRYFQSLLTAALLPSLERRIVDLNAIVNDRKKGMRNLVKSFWRKPKEDTSSASASTSMAAAATTALASSNTTSSTGANNSDNGSNKSTHGQSSSVPGGGTTTGDGNSGGTTSMEEVKYRYDSIESQTLLLADTLFLMEDYDNALSMYRLIRDDYKSDKAWVHYGNVLEMIALCMYQLDPYTRPREIFSLLEQALVVYTRAAEEERVRNGSMARQQLGADNTTTAQTQQQQQQQMQLQTTQRSYITRLACRLSLVLAVASDTLARGRDLECADLLASVSSYESSLGAAVLMEQSSVFYFKAGMCRKYAFHMLMSGHMFQKAGENHHAFRCFASALYIYRTEMWDNLYNHLKTALAAQLYTMGRMSVALVLYAKLIGTTSGGKVSVQSQQKFLLHLVEICQEHKKAALAGADRMAVPSGVPRNRREQFRNQRLEQVVKVIRYTRGASRVLELPHVDCPRIADSSLRVWTKSDDKRESDGSNDRFHLVENGDGDDNNTSSGSRSRSAVETGEAIRDGDGKSQKLPPTSTASSAKTGCRLGTPSRGDEKVWEELELMTVAEVNNAAAAAKDKTHGNKNNQSEETTTAALAKIEDPEHRRFIAEIDKEKQNRFLAERNKRKHQKSQPVVRARGEPIFCDFRMKNPLGIQVKITELQLVARMVAAVDTTTNTEDYDINNKTCTNEFAIELNNETTETRADRQSEWTFACTDDLLFKVPQFSRISKPNVKGCTSARSNPFFVVTKQEVELPAEGETVVSTSIAPLIEGNLEILGVRCKLLDKVWLYHAFEIPGPLLKDTRTNVMNKVRGESMYLRSKIECDMPCLTAELIKRLPPESPALEMDDGPMLEGQISTWTVRLRNVGTAPASAITLKTNLPWIDIVDNDNSDNNSNSNINNTNTTIEEKESKSTSHCIGPSGTLMALPIAKGSIGPSESLDIQVRVRTSGKKKQDFYMLYRYELCDTLAAGGRQRSKSSDRCRSRWLRKMYQVPVYISLSFTANPLATFYKGKDSLVSVELTNDRMDRPTDLYVTLDRLSLTSRRYRLEALPGQFTKSKEFGDVLQIGWQERVTVFYRVILPVTEESKSEDNNRSIILSECPFSESGFTTAIECVSSSATNYLCLDNAYSSFQSAWKAHQQEMVRLENIPDGEKEHPRSIHSIRRANTSDLRGDSNSLKIENHPTSIGSLCPPSTSDSKIHLTCSWRAILGQEVIFGEHYLRAIPIRPVTFFRGCPIAASAEHASKMEHDFSKSPLARVPIGVTLKNRMLETPVKFSWSWDPMAPLLSSSSSSFGDFELIGICQQHLELDANAEITIPLEVLIPRAGTYNLQALRFSIDPPDGTTTATNPNGTNKNVTYHLSHQWLVQLLDSTPTETTDN